MAFIAKQVYLSLLVFLLTSCSGREANSGKEETGLFLSDLKYRTFSYFWELADSGTWQIPDRHPTRQFTSIAATGFGLASYLVGIENGYISREEGRERVKNTLSWLWNAVQGPGTEGTTGYRGFFYHFLGYGNGVRYRQVELSTIDTGLLMAGILACQSYFNKPLQEEETVRALADSLYLRVEWDWAMNGQEHMSMGWHPEKGFIPAKWTGYNEAMILLILALGSPTHPVDSDAWENWCQGYRWEEFYGRKHVNFSPLFGHQYSHMFIDFRNIYDDYMRQKGIDYFINAKRATLAVRDYCIDNPGNFEGYGPHIWGLTACDGPANTQIMRGKDTLKFFTYRARGASALEIVDDGTIAPTAAGGSLPFAPEICIPALLEMKNVFGSKLYQEYGFKDAFNLTYRDGTGEPWFDKDYLGIDQGPILLQLENYQSELIWKLMKSNPYIVNGLVKAGFSGGWLDFAAGKY